MRRYQHYHWCGATPMLTLCWLDGQQHRERYLFGTTASAIHQRLLHAPDQEHAVMILNTVIDGAI